MNSDDGLIHRISALEARITVLETELARLRSEVASREEIEGEQSIEQPFDAWVGPPSLKRTGREPGRAGDASAAEPAVPPVMGPRSGEGQSTAKPRARIREKDPLESVRAVLRSEDILSKVGIGLLLIGLAFMFKFGIDQGWITPAVRVAFGFLLGIALSIGGFRVRLARRRFSRVLMGGAVATFYVTIFSAHQLYSLFSYEAAFVLMVLVTAASFALSIRQDDVVLALIATAGGLGTPFLLYAGTPGIFWLIIYMCLVCGSATGIYFYRGWRWLLVLTAAGGWGILWHVWLQIRDIGYLPVGDTVAYQSGVLICLVLFGVLPVLREVMAERDPDEWPVPKLAVRLGVVADRPGLWLAVASPLAALALSRGVWDVDPVVWGALEVVFATAYWAGYLFRRTTEHDLAASGFGLAAGLLLAISWFDLFQNESLTLLALTAEAGAIMVVTKVSEDRPVRILGHLLFTFVAAWMFLRLSDVPEEPALFRVDSIVHLLVVAGLVASAGLVKSEAVKSGYRVVAMLLLALAWASLFAGGSARFIVLAVHAAVVMFWVQFLEDRWLRYTGYFLFGALALAMFQRITQMPGAMPPLVNGASLADLLVIGIAGVVSFAVADRRVRLTYRFGAYVAFLLWFWRDLAPLNDGHAYVSIAWGAIAVALIVIGWRIDRDLVRQTGLGTMGIVVLKLFLVDLAELDPVWRIVLFIGFGGLLLLVSYLFPSIWRGDVDEAEAQAVPSEGRIVGGSSHSGTAVGGSSDPGPSAGRRREDDADERV